MKSVAIITARGGSKRIPKKNIKNFLGKPILAYSIEAALQSELFDEVMVSTDDQEIADIARLYGASVPFLRSSTNSGDYSSTVDVLVEVINEYKYREYDFEFVACIYPTAPFITADKLKDAFRLFIEKKVDTLISVVPYSFPPQRGLYLRDEKVFMLDKTAYKSRSQDLETIYHDCGQLYMMRTESILKKKHLITDNTVPYILPELQVQDIDTEEDWKLAEMKYRIMVEKF